MNNKEVEEYALKITKNTTIGCERVRFCVVQCVSICSVDGCDRLSLCEDWIQ